MVFNQTVSSGQLVKKIRKSLGLRQYQIVNDQITRNLISLVENNKIPLTANSAKIIIECINEHAEAKGSPIRITDQDLRIDGIFEARLKIASYLETFDNVENEGRATIEFMIHDINVLLSQYDLPEQKMLLFKIIADYFVNRGDLSSALIYYLKCYEATVRISDVDATLEILSTLVSMYLKNGENLNAIRFAKIAENIAPINSSAIFQTILFNKAMAFEHHKEYKRCVWEVDRLIKNWPMVSASRLFELKLLKADSLLKLEYYQESLEIYQELYRASEKPLEQALSLSKIVTANRYLDRLEEIKEPLDLLLKQLTEMDDSVEYACQMELDAAKGQLFIGDLSGAKKSILKCLGYAAARSDQEYTSKALRLMMNESLDGFVTSGEVLSEVTTAIEKDLLQQTTPFVIKTLRYFNSKRLPEALEEVMNLFESRL